MNSISQIKKGGLLRNSTLYTFFNVVRSAIPFLLLPFLTRFLTPEDYGKVAMFTLLYTFLIPVICMGARGAVQKKYYDCNNIEYGEYLFNFIIITFFSSVFLSILSLFSAPLLFPFLQLDQNWIILAIVQTFFAMISETLLILWQNRNKVLSFGILQISRSLVNLSLSLLLIKLYDMGWEGRATGIFISFTLSGIISLILLIRNNEIVPKYNKNYLVSMLRFGLPVIPHTISGMLILLSDRFFLTYFLGIESAGIYEVGSQVGKIIFVLQDSLNKAWVPWFYSSLKNGMKDKVIRATYLLWGLLILITVTIALALPCIYDFFIDKKFKEAMEISTILLFAFLFNGLYKIIIGYIMLLEKTSILAIVSVFTAFLNLVLNYFFVNRYGVVGPAYATAISFLASFIITLIITSRLYPMPWFKAVKLLR